MNKRMLGIMDIKSDLEILKDKISDLVETNYYLIEDYFEQRQLENRKEVENFALSYREIRIKTNQSQELLLLYKKEMQALLKKLDSELSDLKEVE
ncbi:type II toxin-antitoxin system toxin TscT [Mammaliicoccus sciuri]|uniref:type II toxin-antitoxin system toxin TscT n=1 Tax=Mammaliicoccus sciuri TaxID=1296 RepID=UPI003AC45635